MRVDDIVDHYLLSLSFSLFFSTLIVLRKTNFCLKYVVLFFVIFITSVRTPLAVMPISANIRISLIPQHQ